MTAGAAAEPVAATAFDGIPAPAVFRRDEKPVDLRQGVPKAAKHGPGAVNVRAGVPKAAKLGPDAVNLRAGIPKAAKHGPGAIDLRAGVPKARKWGRGKPVPRLGKLTYNLMIRALNDEPVRFNN